MNIKEKQTRQREIEELIQNEISRENNGNKTINRENIILSGHEAVHEKYFWNGYSAESIILKIEEVNHLSEIGLRKLLYQNDLCKINTEILIEYDENNVFLNFNYSKPKFKIQ